MTDYSKYVVGRSHGKTEHGLSLSLLKSALQKYVRRNETERAVGCLHEANTLLRLETAGPEELADFESQNKQKGLAQKTLNQFGKAQRTNMANRLLVMCSEEVNIHDHPLIPVHVWRLYNRWLGERHQEESVRYLAQIASLLSNAQKGRLLSYLKSAFDLPPYYVKDKFRAQYKTFHQTQVLGRFADVEERSRCEVYDLATFKACVESKEVERAFRCLGVLCSTTEHKPLFKEVWGYLRKAAFGNASVQALYEMYSKMSHQERPLYLYHALLLHMYRDQLRWDEPMIMPAVPDAVPDAAVLHSIDDYARDHHVSGVKSLQSYVKLLKESFYVPPSHLNRTFVRADYEALYTYIKIAVGHFEEHKAFPSDEQTQLYIANHLEASSLVREAPNGFIASLEAMPLAQRRTGRQKKFVRIDFESARIIKGPYRASELAYQNALKFNEALTLLDTNTGVRTAWEWETVYRSGEDHYLVTPFVASHNQEASTVPNVESWEGGHTYNCFERDSKVVGSRIKDLVDEDRLTDDLTKQAVVQHFYLRYVLGVGDSNLSNVLKVEHSTGGQLVAGIDLEERRTRYDATDIYKMVMGTNVKKQRLLLEPYLNTVTRVRWDQLPETFHVLFSGQEVADMVHRDSVFHSMKGRSN